MEALNLRTLPDANSPVISVLLSKMRSVSPSKIALDLTEMRFLGCECEIPSAFPYHVDFPTSHELCDLHRRFEAEQWLAINARGGYNFYRYFCAENEKGRLLLRFAFVYESDAVLFKTAWY